MSAKKDINQVIEEDGKVLGISVPTKMFYQFAAVYPDESMLSATTLCSMVCVEKQIINLRTRYDIQ